MKTLAQARREVIAGRDDGIRCPCCDRFAKNYRRLLGSSMAASLVQLHAHSARLPKDEPWIHVQDYLSAIKSRGARGGDVSKLTFWGLLEALEQPRLDGSKRNGYYRVTPRGSLFAKGELSVPKYVWIYNNTQLPSPPDVPRVDVRIALRDRFDYQELMRSAAAR